MKLNSHIELHGYGTSEGVTKEWNTRGRGRKKQPSYSPQQISKFKKIAGMSFDDYIKSKIGFKYKDSLGRDESFSGKEHEVRTEKYYYDAVKKFVDSLKASSGQTDTSSLMGRKYYIVDRYGHVTGEYDDPAEAETAAQAKPWSKVVSKARAEQTQEVRDLVRQRLVKTNPDID